MKRQLTLFFTALQFYTRIPVPASIHFDAENLGPASRFLPVAGWLVGVVSALVWTLAGLVDQPVAVISAMLASILLTGALHEDGFADFCDGFGGGWTKEKILLIMKDSRIGAYGVIGLIGILALKFSLLYSISISIHSKAFCLILITAHALSRFMPVLIIYKYPYARDTDDSKAKPVAQNLSRATLLIAAAFGLIPLLALTILLKTTLIILALPIFVIVTFLMGQYFKKWIGGYTGDCLGAVQQVCEVTFYFFLVTLWKFI